MDIAFYEKVIIENPDFPIVVLENNITNSLRQQLCPLHWHEHLELHYIIEGTLDIAECLRVLEEMELHPREVLKIVKRNHIFTHVEWNMQGVFCEVSNTIDDFVWKTTDEINADVALPTAFRQFWEVR